MATKNLARTVIEGGRHPRNVWERRSSNTRERRQVRETSALLRDRLDPDAVVYPRRNPVYQGFDDKLSPGFRWLRAQSGRPWNKVRSELFTRFDTRTTAGRHIVFEHLLEAVEHAPRRSPRRDDLFVDRHGLLHSPPYRRQRGRSWQPLPEPAHELCAWLGQRRVIARGGSLFWLVPTRAGHYRQDKPLSPAEVTRFQSLPAWYLSQREQELLARPKAEDPS